MTRRRAIAATYDSTVDALSIDLRPGVRRRWTVKIAPGILLHCDRAKQPSELEILGASAHCSREVLERLPQPPRPR